MECMAMEAFQNPTVSIIFWEQQLSHIKEAKETKVVKKSMPRAIHRHLNETTASGG